MFSTKSSNLSVCDCFLLEHLEYKEYAISPHTNAELKHNPYSTPTEIRNIPVEMLERAMDDYSDRIYKSNSRNGCHLQN